MPREPDAVAWTSHLTRSRPPTRATSSAAAAASRPGWPTGRSALPGGQHGRASRRAHRPLPRGSLREQGQRARGRRVRPRTASDRLPVRRLGALERRPRLRALRERPIFGNALAELRQVLPTGVGPEGLLAIPERDLFVVANEEDARGDKIRSTIMIYERGGEPTYPTIVSADRDEQRRADPLGALCPGSSPIRTTTSDRLHGSRQLLPQEPHLHAGHRTTTPAVITDELRAQRRERRPDRCPERAEGELPGTDDFDPAALRQRRRHGQPRPRGRRRRSPAGPSGSPPRAQAISTTASAIPTTGRSRAPNPASSRRRATGRSSRSCCCRSS